MREFRYKRFGSILAFNQDFQWIAAIPKPDNNWFGDSIFVLIILSLSSFIPRLPLLERLNGCAVTNGPKINLGWTGHVGLKRKIKCSD